MSLQLVLPARRLIAIIAAASALIPTGALSASAGADTPARVALPDPNIGTGSPGGTPSPANPRLTMVLRIYLSGSNPQGRAATALAVSNPRNPGYAHYLTPVQYEQQFGPSPAQVSAVSDWLTSEGMTITATNHHYITVTAIVAQVDAALDTQITAYTKTFTLPSGETKTLVTYVAVGGFSVPAALGGDVTTVTGFDEFVQAHSGNTSSANLTAPANPGRAGTASGYRCSQYWEQHVVAIPPAYGRTSAPTQLCGYTVSQMRSAYGITSSPYTGKGATIAVVLDDASPTMLADASQFFASQGVPGFAPGQYTENLDGDDETASGLHASCRNQTLDQPEETLDVETAHIIAPDAHVVYMGTNCDGDLQQNFLDTMTNIVDRHLADVVTDSYSITESAFSPADVAAWSLTFEQGALEGIGFNFDSGDGGNYGDGAGNAQFPASDPWATAVGGTSLEIGAKGTPVAEYGWGDGFTQENAAGTGYRQPLPHGGSDGSQGGLSTFFAEPGYQRGVVPAALATAGGTLPAARVVPDVAADAGSHWLIGYTGAITPGAYGQVAMGGGTSGASPIVSGLEADAKQASGHAVGFANPAIYQLAGTPAIHDILPVNLNHPPIVFGPIPDDLQSPDNYLIALGQDDGAAPGYDDVTGVGAVTPAFITSFTCRSRARGRVGWILQNVSAERYGAGCGARLAPCPMIVGAFPAASASAMTCTASSSW
jgi:subtilase family serine protease